MLSIIFEEARLVHSVYENVAVGLPQRNGCIEVYYQVHHTRILLSDIDNTPSESSWYSICNNLEFVHGNYFTWITLTFWKVTLNAVLEMFWVLKESYWLRFLFYYLFSIHLHMIRDLFGTVSDIAHEIRQNLLFGILSDTVSCSVITKAVNGRGGISFWSWPSLKVT